MNTPGRWRKSSRSGGNAGNSCVEARKASTLYQVRDSKLGEASEIFDLNQNEWMGFLNLVRE